MCRLQCAVGIGANYNGVLRAFDGFAQGVFFTRFFGGKIGGERVILAEFIENFRCLVGRVVVGKNNFECRMCLCRNGGQQTWQIFGFVFAAHNERNGRFHRRFWQKWFLPQPADGKGANRQHIECHETICCDCNDAHGDYEFRRQPT